MKALIFIGCMALFLPLLCGGEEDTLAVSSDMIEQILLEMPIKSMDYYSERFYPETIKAINRKFYSRKARSKKRPEKRIRNIKLNQFLNIPNDRQGERKSSFTFMSNVTHSTFVIYTVKDGSGGKQIIDIRSPDAACIFGMSAERTAVKAKACREDVPNMIWDLLPNKYGDFWMKQRGTDLCLAPVLTMGLPYLVQLLPCDRWNPYMIWEIHDAYLYYKK